jgi:hypothetical protein
MACTKFLMSQTPSNGRPLEEEEEEEESYSFSNLKEQNLILWKTVCLSL